MPSILVTDFDGTVTAHDFYRLVTEELLTPRHLTPWHDYRARKITHFQAMQRIYAEIKAPESRIRQILKDMRADPSLASSAEALKQAGWRVVVASAGCEWYVRLILQDMGVNSFEVHANPGIYHEGGPLELRPPLDSPFYSPELGIDKAGIVRHYQQSGFDVAYAGDGFTDVEAALLASPAWRFARGDLAQSLKRQNEPFQSFSRWSQVAQALLEQKDYSGLTLTS